MCGQWGRKRSYVVVVESLRSQVATNSVKSSVRESASAPDNKEGVIFWMRDPKSGNWIPENHFGEAPPDAAELRDKFLPKRSQNL